MKTTRVTRREPAEPSMDQLEVRILDRDYKLVVSPEDRPRLLESVRIVDNRMRTIRDAGRVGGLDRIAVLAALQLAHELIGMQHEQKAAVAAPPAPTSDASVSDEVLDRIRRMSAELDEEIARQEKLV